MECKGISNSLSSLKTYLKRVSFQNVVAVLMDLIKQNLVILQLVCVIAKEMLLARNVISVMMDILIFQIAKVGFKRLNGSKEIYLRAFIYPKSRDREDC